MKLQSVTTRQKIAVFAGLTVLMLVLDAIGLGNGSEDFSNRITGILVPLTALGLYFFWEQIPRSKARHYPWALYSFAWIFVPLIFEGPNRLILTCVFWMLYASSMLIAANLKKDSRASLVMLGLLILADGLILNSSPVLGLIAITGTCLGGWVVLKEIKKWQKKREPKLPLN